MYLYVITHPRSSTPNSPPDFVHGDSAERLAIFTSPYRAHAFISSLVDRERANIRVLKPAGILPWLIEKAAAGATSITINPGRFSSRAPLDETISIGRLLRELGKTAIEQIRTLGSAAIGWSMTDRLWHCKGCGKILRQSETSDEYPSCCGHPMHATLADLSASQRPTERTAD